MTTVLSSLIGASSTDLTWDAIDWQTVEKSVRRLQMRIAKATKERRWGKVKALQWLLTHSFSAKLLAVKRVVTNRGRNTAGVDRIIWNTSKKKLQAARSMQRRGYQPQPLRCTYIPKKNGKQRPLSIPTMADRAMQALHLQALEPVAEMQADKNAYGFRPKRSTADAIGQCFIVFARKHPAQWILEGDIKSCFDRISHSWLIDHIPMDKHILKKWLAAGYIEEGILHPTEAGTPQGGIASAILANMTLDGLERVAKQAAHKGHKVNIVKYADDFVITADCREVLEDKVIPKVAAFLKERGLQLSEEKTKITHIDDGFDFLGFSIRKYSGKLLIKPSKQSIKSFLAKVRACIKSNRTATTEQLIRQLNPMIRGWANYYRHVVAKKTFSYVDYQVFLALRSWINRRHPDKSAKWKRKRYFRNQGPRNWIFSATVRDKQGKATPLDLFRASDVAITRHVKIRAEATPYDPAFKDYFVARARSRRVNPYAWSGMVAETRLDDQKNRQTRSPGQVTGLTKA